MQKATTAKERTERADIIETAQMDILGKQAENHGSLSEDELVEILTSSNYNTKGRLSDNGEESVLQKTLTSNNGKYEILVSEIYNGSLGNNQKISFYIKLEDDLGGVIGPFEAIDGLTFGEWIENYNPLGFSTYGPSKQILYDRGVFLMDDDEGSVGGLATSSSLIKNGNTYDGLVP